MNVHDLPTPSLLIDRATFDHNVATMSAALPGPRLRPHVKAFKSTALAARLVVAGHAGFCCATIREVEGMAAAGLGEDLLLANEVVDARRLGAVVASGAARVTVAVDSETTIAAAAGGGVREVLIDVNNGFRCGCEPEDAGRLADLARAAGLEVRGVMGYEGHVSLNPIRASRVELLEVAMARLARAYADVGGDVISGAGTGTYDLNTLVTEVQAGSYTLMDTEYAKLGLPFRQALFLWAAVISVNDRVAICDAGLKAQGMDHGDPTIEGADVLYCSDEHVVFIPHAPTAPPSKKSGGEEGRASVENQPAPDTSISGGPWHVGDRVRLTPAHVDPTVAMHERMWLVDGDEVIDEWPVDLRNW